MPTATSNSVTLMQSTGTGIQAPTTITLAMDGGTVRTIAPAEKIGYDTGAGGTVTQITSRSTGVTINVPCGKIQTDTSSLAAAAEATFTVTNSRVEIGDVVVVSLRSGSIGGTPQPYVSAVAAGSFDITITNLHGTTGETGALIINFAVLKAVTA